MLPKTKKAPNLEYNPENLRVAIEKVRKKELSIAEAARIYIVPQATIRMQLKTPMKPGIKKPVVNQHADDQGSQGPQGDVKENEDNAAGKMTELDKFKRRLIRSVSRLMLTERKPTHQMWEELQKETGCDCKMLWNRMRALTIKKLDRLLAANDQTKNVSSVARLSATDWLQFDLVLVHEDIDLLGNTEQTDATPFWNLFELVQGHGVELASPGMLPAVWLGLTDAYNNSKDSECSPMLLQKRWHQLKEATRRNFYNLWATYRGNPRLWDSARDHQPSVLQMAIAKRFPHIITKPFEEWRTLIEMGLVVLPDEFEKATKNPDEKRKSSVDHPDLVVIEPEIETIDLGQETDSDEPAKEEAPPPDTAIRIKQEPLDEDGLSNVQILTTTHVPDVESIDSDRSSPTTTETEKELRQNILATQMSKYMERTKTFENDNLVENDSTMEDDDPSDLVNEKFNEYLKSKQLPRDVTIVSNARKLPSTAIDDVPVVSNAESEVTATVIDDDDEDLIPEDLIQAKANEYCNKTEPVSTKSRNEPRVESKEVEEDVNTKIKAPLRIVQMDTSDEDDIIIQAKLDEYLNKDKNESAKSNENLNEVSKDGAECSTKELDTDKESPDEYLDDIIKIKAQEFVKKSDIKKLVSDVVQEFDFRDDNMMEIVDDGIEILDDGIEYFEDDEDCAFEDKKERKEDIEKGPEPKIANEDLSSKFDLKLLMVPVVYTTRLDQMALFAQKPPEAFSCIENKQVIEEVLALSKPFSKKAVNIKKETAKYEELFANQESTKPIQEMRSENTEDETTNREELLKKKNAELVATLMLCQQTDVESEKQCEELTAVQKTDKLVKELMRSKNTNVETGNQSEELLLKQKNAELAAKLMRCKDDVGSEEHGEVLTPELNTAKVVEELTLSKNTDIESAIQSEELLLRQKNAELVAKLMRCKEDVGSDEHGEVLTPEQKTAKLVEELLRSHKAKVSDAQTVEDEFPEGPNSSSDEVESEEEAISEDLKVKPTSFLLQKPRNRAYNPILLCKNPDFNTRLKRLTVGFFASSRNRQLLKACMPVTIDLHKSFESKLINKTLYLKSSMGDTSVDATKKDSEQVTVAPIVIPSAMPVQSLMNATVKPSLSTPVSSSTSLLSTIDLTSRKSSPNFNTVDLTDKSSPNSNTVDLTSKSDADFVERNKVINLRDLSEIRRINQRLQTAEVPPIPVDSPSHSAAPMVSIPTEHVTELNAGPLAKTTSESNSDDPNLASPEDDSSNDSLYRPDTAQRSSYRGARGGRGSRGGRGRGSKVGYLPYLRIQPDPKKQAAPWTKPAHGLPKDDFLITIDTLNKMINKINGADDESLTYKQRYRLKLVQEREDRAKEKAAERALCPEPDTPKPSETKTRPAPKIQPPPKKNISSLIQIYCCWCREKISKIDQHGKRIRKKHECVEICNCCCRSELVELIKQRPKLHYKFPIVTNKDTILLSDEEAAEDSSHPGTPRVRVYHKEKTKNHFMETMAATASITPAPVGRGLHLTVGAVTSDGAKACSVPVVTQVMSRVDFAQQTDGPIEVPSENDAVNIQDCETTIDLDKQQCTTQPVAMQQELTTQQPVVMQQPVKTKKPIIIKKPVNMQKPITTTSPVTMSSTISQSDPNKFYVLPAKRPVGRPPKKVIYPHQIISSKSPTIIAKSNTFTPLPALAPRGGCIKYTVVPDHETLRGTTVDPEERLIMIGDNTNLSTPRPRHTPIFLGKNKILLSTVKMPRDLDTSVSLISSPEKKQFPQSSVVPTLPLPYGVQLVLMPSGELTYTMTEPGLVLTQEQEATIATILEAVKQQIGSQIQSQTLANLQAPVDIVTEPVNVNTISKPDDDTNKNCINAEDKDTIQEISDDEESEETTEKMNKDITTISGDIVIEESSGDMSKEASESIAEGANDDIRKEISDSITEEVSKNATKAGNEDITNKASENISTEINKDTTLDSSIQDESCSNVSKEQEKPVEIEKTAEASESNAGASTSRNLLSDLMEMSGISADDAIIPQEICPQPPTATTVFLGGELTSEQVPEIINTLSQTVSNLPTAAPNPVIEMKLPPLTSISPKKTAITELCPISSLKELKYSCDNYAKFFKLDLNTGLLIPINVAVKRAKKTTAATVSKSVIDLTDDAEDEETISVSNVKDDVKDNSNYKLNSSVVKNYPLLSNVKPLKLFKTIRNRNTQASESVKEQAKRALERLKKITLPQNRRRKQIIRKKDEPRGSEGLTIVSSDSERESEAVNVDSEDSSDDEPLAVLSKRLKSNETIEKSRNEILSEIPTVEGAVSEPPIEERTSTDPKDPTSKDIENEETVVETNKQAENKECGDAVATEDDMDIDEEMPVTFLEEVADNAAEEDCILGF